MFCERKRELIKSTAIAIIKQVAKERFICLLKFTTPILRILFNKVAIFLRFKYNFRE